VHLREPAVPASIPQDGNARGWTSEAAFEHHQSAERYFAELVELVSPLHPLLAASLSRSRSAGRPVWSS
jgi:hypothetical protein